MKYLLLTVAPGAGAVIAWLICLPYLPYAPVRGATIEQHYSLGTTWGLLHSALYGVLVCAPIAFYFALERNIFSKALIIGSVGGIAGAISVVLADAASDIIDISLEQRGVPRMIVQLPWHFAIGAALGSAVAISCLIVGLRIRVVLAATLLASLASLVLGKLIGPFVQAAFVRKATQLSDPALSLSNLWELFGPAKMAQSIVMAVVFGIAVGVANHGLHPSTRPPG